MFPTFYCFIYSICVFSGLNKEFDSIFFYGEETLYMNPFCQNVPAKYNQTVSEQR